MGTRKQVATAAGVSLRTVDNVVNGDVRVSSATRDRVEAAIADLDYHPSAIARSLKRGRSGLIGLALPDLATPYFAELTRAVVTEGAGRGITIVIDQTDGDLDRERSVVDRAARGSLIDALIISPIALTPHDLDPASTKRPLVLLGENAFPGFDQIMIDNVEAARDAVAHLVATGRRRIAAIGAPTRDDATSSLRLRGYEEALSAAGIERDRTLIEPVESYGRASGAAAMEGLLHRTDPPDAVFCFSDPLALGALRVLNLRGARVPEDIAVVGFDDIEDGLYSTPSLTSISPDKHVIARAALDRVESLLAGAGSTEGGLIIAPHSLIVRESSARMRTTSTHSTADVT